MFPKPTPYRNRVYLAWIRHQPCAVCGRTPAFPGRPVIESAHTGMHGLGTKASDFRAIPLCKMHHRDDLTGLDKIGPDRFEEIYHVNIRESVLNYIEQYLAEGHTL